MIFLKKIYAEGFKSFALPTTLEFKKNMVGIIGPNGSGKSNIVDALKWTIGEQSVKQLRSSERTDLIFMGSAILPEAKYALIELTFDNSNNVLHTDLKEVKITRKLTKKTEESQFFINDQPAKLKDIQDMFLDTGLSRGSLGIISQGTVSWFADAKPEERRKIFEEASGIGKYTKKKQESTNLLEKSQNSLYLLSEHLDKLKKEVTKLENQAKKAKEYNEKRAKLKLYDLVLKSKEILSFRQEISLLENSITDLEEKVKTYSFNLENLNDSINNNERIYSRLEQEITSLLFRKDELSKVVANLVNKKSIFDSKINNQINSNNLEDRIKAYEVVIQNNKSELDFLTKEVQKNELELEELNNKKNKFYNDLNELNSKHQQLFNKQLNLETEIKFLNNQQLQANRFDLGVKTILENKNSLNGIVGLVSDLIKVDSKYEISISTALGNSLKNIVTLDANSAVRAIEFLKSNKSGFATFLPLDKIKEKSIKPELLTVIRNSKGFIGVASDLVKIDEKYKAVTKHLLGNTIIADEIRNAVNISDLVYSSYKIITLDGDIQAAGGAISGGHKKNNNFVFNIEEKISKLNSELEVVLNELKDSNNRINETKFKENETLGSISRLTIVNNTNKIKIQDLENSISRNKNEYESLTNKSFDLNSEINTDDIQKELLVAEKKLKNIELELSEKNNSKKLVFEQLSQQRTEANEKNQNVSSYSSDLSRDKLKLNDINNKLENIKQIIVTDYKTTVESAIEEYSNKELDISLQEAKHQVSILKNDLDNLGPINQTAIEELEVRSKELEEVQKNHDEVQKVVDDINNTILELDKKAKHDFKKIIDSVNKDIPNIFKELFGGGTCEIKLTDPNNILETGIEILAQPLGKKISSLMLLSGGEKTLVALSILFSILKCSNFPLVVLDEAEAALDEYNVELFAKTIKKFSSNNQFLIITHRPGTMKLCDELFGITMQDKGVSMVLKTSFDNIVFNNKE